MKLLLSVLAAICLLAGGSNLHAAGVSGTWKGAFEFQGSSVPLTFHLTETGNAVAGSIEGLPTTPTEIHDGQIAGDKVSFWTDTDYQGQTYKLEFTGRLSSAADAISFTMATDDGSWSSELLARRDGQAAAEQQTSGQAGATGTWKGSFEFEGSAVPVTMHLQDAGDTVTGTVMGMIDGAPEKSVELQDGKLQGDKLTFWLNTEYQGQTYKIVYNGTFSDGKIQFTFGTVDGSWSSEMSMTKAAGE